MIIRVVKRFFTHAFYDNTIEKYSNLPSKKITLNDLLHASVKPVTTEKLLKSATYVAHELPIRLAKRVQSMQQLPYIVGLNPHIRKVYLLYQESFEKIRTFPPIKTPQTELEFSNLLSDLVSSHSDVIALLAHGIQECKKYMTEHQVAMFLDGMIQARIGIRVIAEHHLALHETSINSSTNTPSNYSGIINHSLSPFDIISKCAPYAQDLSEVNYGSYPEYIIQGHTNTTFTFIDVHLEYMIFELLKNAFRATVLHSRRIGRPSSMHPPVIITIGNGKEDVSIRIRDEGGGISPDKLPNVWRYSFSTVSEDDSLDTFDTGDGGTINVLADASRMAMITGTGGPIAGLGYGLPMSRIYAGWAGGSLDLVSLENHGCDVFLRLPSIVNLIKEL